MKIDPLIAEHGLFQSMITLESGEETERHHHTATHETYTIIDGEGIVTVGGKTNPVRPRDFVSIPVHTPHRIINTGLLPLIVLSTKNGKSNDTVSC